MNLQENNQNSNLSNYIIDLITLLSKENKNSYLINISKILINIEKISKNFIESFFDVKWDLTLFSPKINKNTNINKERILTNFLNNKTLEGKDGDLIDYLLENLIQNNYNEEIKNCYLKILSLFIENTSINSNSLKKFYKLIIDDLNLKKNYKYDEFYNILDLFEIIYGTKFLNANGILPKNYFIFFGNNNGINFIENNFDYIVIKNNINNENNIILIKISFRSIFQSNECSLIQIIQDNIFLNILCKKNCIYFNNEIIYICKNEDLFLDLFLTYFDGFLTISIDNQKDKKIIFNFKEKINISLKKTIKINLLNNKFIGEVYSICLFYGIYYSKITNFFLNLFEKTNFNNIHNINNITKILFNFICNNINNEENNILLIKKLIEKLFIFHPSFNNENNNSNIYIENKKFLFDIFKKNKFKVDFFVNIFYNFNINKFDGIFNLIPLIKIILENEKNFFSEEIINNNKENLLYKYLNMIITLYKKNKNINNFDKAYKIICYYLNQFDELNLFKNELTFFKIQEFIFLINFNDINSLFEYKLFFKNFNLCNKYVNKFEKIFFNICEVALFNIKENKIEKAKYFLLSLFIKKDINSFKIDFSKDEFRIYKFDLELIKIIIYLLEENKGNFFYWIFDIFLNYYIILINSEEDNFKLNIKELTNEINIIQNYEFLSFFVNNLKTNNFLNLYICDSFQFFIIYDIYIIYKEEENDDNKIIIKYLEDTLFKSLNKYILCFSNSFLKVIENKSDLNISPEEKIDLISLYNFLILKFPNCGKKTFFNYIENLIFDEQNLKNNIINDENNIFIYLIENYYIFLLFSPLIIEENFDNYFQIIKSLFVEFIKFFKLFYLIYLKLSNLNNKNINLTKYENIIFYIYNMKYKQKIIFNYIPEYININYIKNKESIDVINKLIKILLDNKNLYLKSINNYLNFKLLYEYLKIPKLYKKILKKITIYGLWNFCSDYKYKILNYLTNDFKKPLLTKILDIEYYFPKFSNLKDKYSIFNKKNEINKIFNLNIINDDNKYLKSNQKISNLENKEDFFYNLIDLNYYHNYINQKILYDKNILIQNCCLVKLSHHIKGFIYIEKNNIIFKSYNNNSNKNICSKINSNDKCFGSIFNCPIKDENKEIIIKLSEISLIFMRKYFYHNSAIEIFTFYGKNYYFNFHDEKDLLCFYKSLQKINFFDKKMIEIIKNLDNNKYYINKKYLNLNFPFLEIKEIKDKNLISLDNFIEQWKNNNISTYKFLMILNLLGNRSFNDLYQYPIFPWIFFSNEENENENNINKKNKNLMKYKILNFDKNSNYKIILRPLELPLGQIDLYPVSKFRINSYNENYLNIKNKYLNSKKNLYDKDNICLAFHYNINYSNPPKICNYLLRIIPYSFLNIELQGDYFTDQSRIFNNLYNTSKNVLTLIGDIKELIPEIYYLPELYYNINDFNFKDKNLNLNNIELFKFFDKIKLPKNKEDYINKYFLFCKFCLDLLENECVSKKINLWFDLIFGKEQKPSNPEKIKNLFRPECYYEYSPNFNYLSKDEKFFLYQQVEFGLIPKQLLINEYFPEKKKQNFQNFEKNTINNYIIDFNKNYEKNNINHLYFVKILNNLVFLINLENIIIYNDNFNLKQNLYLNNINKDYFEFNKNYNNKIVYSKKDNFFILCGNNYEELILFDIKQNTYFEFNIMENNYLNYYENLEEKKIISKKITALELIELINTYLICGCSDGDIIIYKIELKLINSSHNLFEILNFYKELNHHMNEITFINYNYELNLLLSCSKDGYINIYTINEFKLCNSIKINGFPRFGYLICDSISYIFVYVDDEYFQYYTINGIPIIKEKNSFSEISNPILFKNNKNEYCLLFLDNQLRNIYIINVYENNKIKNLLNTEYNQIHSFDLSEDHKFIISIDMKGQNLYKFIDNKCNFNIYSDNILS